jgi:ankyrin repeat protein
MTEVITMLQNGASSEDDVLSALKKYIESGGTTNLQDEQGQTFLLMATYYQNWEKVISYLIQQGADVNLPDLNDQSPLRIAVQFSTAKIIQMLVDAGADVHYRDFRGRTPKDICWLRALPKDEVIEILDRAMNSAPGQD